MKLKHYAADGVVGEDRDFAVPEFEGDRGVEALRQVLVASMTNLRQGNASTLTRSEVRGGGRKPHRQKGTGLARHGSRRSPIWRGGGVVFGPRPRDYTQKINRKMKRLAFRRAIFDRAISGDIRVIERFDGAQSKTREMESLLRRIVPGGAVLLVDDSFADATVLAARNIERVVLGEADTVNSFDFSRCDTILISEKGFDCVLARASGEAKS